MKMPRITFGASVVPDLYSKECKRSQRLHEQINTLKAVLESTKKPLEVANEQLVESDSVIVVKLLLHFSFSNRLFFIVDHVCSLPIIGLGEQLNTLSLAIDAVTSMVNTRGET
jgi:hypothetical protein